MNFYPFIFLATEAAKQPEPAGGLTEGLLGIIAALIGGAIVSILATRKQFVQAHKDHEQRLVRLEERDKLRESKLNTISEQLNGIDSKLSLYDTNIVQFWKTFKHDFISELKDIFITRKEKL